jgi:hypothetical protein
MASVIFHTSINLLAWANVEGAGSAGVIVAIFSLELIKRSAKQPAELLGSMFVENSLTRKWIDGIVLPMGSEPFVTHGLPLSHRFTKGPIGLGGGL